MCDSSSESQRKNIQLQNFINRQIEYEQSLHLNNTNSVYDDDELERRFDVLHKQPASNYNQHPKFYNDLNQNYVTQTNTNQREYNKRKNPIQHRPSTAPATVRTQDQTYNQNFSKDQHFSVNSHANYGHQQKISNLNESQMIGDGFNLSNMSSNQKFSKYNSKQLDTPGNGKISIKSARNMPELVYNHNKFNDYDSSDDHNHTLTFPSITMQHCQTETTSKSPVMDEFNLNANSAKTENCHATSKSKYVNKVSEDKINILRKTQEIINVLINSEIDKTVSTNRMHSDEMVTKLNDYRRNRMQSFENIEQEILKLKQLDGTGTGLQIK